MKKYDITTLMFIFCMLFLPKIGSVDLSAISMLLFAVVLILKNKRIILSKKVTRVFLFIFVFISIFIMNSLFKETDTYILFRYVRCFINLISIWIFVHCHKPTPKIILESTLIILTIHAILILISIIIPYFESNIYFFSRYSKKFLRWRATGLCSGYDFAGFYTNCGFLLSIIYNSKYKNKTYSIISIVFLCATIFTSRTSTIMIMVIVVIMALRSFILRKGSFISTMIIVVPIIGVGLIFSILTLDELSGVKNVLISKYEFISVLDATINETYSDGNYGDSFSSHFYVEGNIDLVFGNSIHGKVDPGITNSIYEAGYVGLILKLCFLAYIVVSSSKYKNDLKKSLYIICILSFLYEFKLIFLFANGSFEIMMLFYLLGDSYS